MSSSSIELNNLNGHTHTQGNGKHDSVCIHLDDGVKLAEQQASNGSSPSHTHGNGNDIQQPLKASANGPVAYRTPINTIHPPAETLHLMIQGGNVRANRTPLKTIVMSVLAGILISFGGNLGLTVYCMLTGTAYATFAKIGWAVTFPFALMLIFVHQGELFTGNVMYMIAAVVNKTSTWGTLVQNWVLCYIGNYAGTVIFAFFIAYLPEVYNSDAYSADLAALLHSKVGMGWGVVLLKAVACNWLVCTSIWWFNSAEDMFGKLIAVWFPIMCFVLSGFEHCIANMYYLMTALMVTNAETWGTIFAWNIIPVTIGNIIGGALFILFQFAGHGVDAKVHNNSSMAKRLCLP